MIVRIAKNSTLMLVSLIIAVSGLLPIAPAKKVSATHDVPHTCALPPNDPEVLYGRDELCGYFLNGAYLETGGIDGVGLLTGWPQPCTSPWQEALLGVNNIDQFVCAIKFNLFLPDGLWRTTNQCAAPPEGQRRNAAAFIVMTMLGYGNTTGGNSALTACSQFPAWEARVRQYAAAGLINFNHNRSYTKNTLIHTSTLDPMWYHNWSISHIAGDTQFANSITFFSPSGVAEYSIKKDCANPVGNSGLLPPLGHGFSATPNSSVTITPGADDPVNATFTGGISYTGAPFDATISRRDFYIPNGTSTEVTIALVTQPLITFTGSSYSMPPATRNIAALGLSAGDRVCARTQINPGSGTADPSGNIITAGPPRTSANDCITITDKPYFRAYGGDVMAGAGFQNGLSCNTNQDAGILSWNKSANPYMGSGTQLAAFAMGFIFEYSSGQLRSPSLANTLTFPNADPSYNGWGMSEFGGGLNVGSGTATCAPDFYADRTTGTPLGASYNIPSSADGVFSRTGDLTLTSTSSGMINGERITIFVDGDVTISDNITYASVSYGNINDIPRFMLIVRGNIYVSPNVTRLDGIYATQPNPASPNDTGRFYTCWPGNIPTAAEINGVCRTNSLTVYGAVVAELIKFTRSRGSLRDSTTSEQYDNLNGEPAERFIYSPEVWLTGGLGSEGTFDSLTGQPPIL